MYRVSDEAYERVNAAIEDIGYCCETSDEDMNMALGVKTALERALREMLDYISDVPEADEEDEDYDEYDETAEVVAALKKSLEGVKNMEI